MCNSGPDHYSWFHFDRYTCVLSYIIIINTWRLNLRYCLGIKPLLRQGSAKSETRRRLLQCKRDLFWCFSETRLFDVFFWRFLQKKKGRMASTEVPIVVWDAKTKRLRKANESFIQAFLPRSLICGTLTPNIDLLGSAYF